MSAAVAILFVTISTPVASFTAPRIFSIWNGQHLQPLSPRAVHGGPLGRKPLHQLHLGARGFKELEYGGGKRPNDGLGPVERRERWEASYKEHLGRVGLQVCALAYEGFRRSGRGAVLSKDVGGDGTGVDGVSANPHAYFPKKDWEKELPVSSTDLVNLKEIHSRISSYDPEKQFVVVFSAWGLMGCDIVTGNMGGADAVKLWREREEEAGGTSRESSIDSGIIDVEPEPGSESSTFLQ